jgi:glycosyltransferase involved in cell wall biosynthesis
VFEYMTLGIPFVSFDLIEGRKIAGDASLYAANNCPIALADHIAVLLDDENKRAALAAVGQDRAKALLRWDIERGRLLAAYDVALAGRRQPLSATTPAQAR